MVNLSEEIALNKTEWKKRINVANLKIWDEDSVVVMNFAVFL